MIIDGLTYAIENGKYSFLHDASEGTEYEAIELSFGNMLIDFVNASFFKIPIIIKEISISKGECTIENFDLALHELCLKLLDSYSFSTASLIGLSFHNKTLELLTHSTDNIFEFSETSGAVKEDIFSGTEYLDFGHDTIEQFFLSILPELGVFIGMADKILSFVVADDNGDLVMNLFTDFLKLQSIEYWIAIIDGNFTSIYKIKNIISMMAIEVLNIVENDILIKNCDNCGKYFIPVNRSDTLFCDNISPQDENKTCKEYGRYINYLKKTQNDEATKLYKQIYNSKANKAKRTTNKKFENDLINFRATAKDFRHKVKTGIIGENEYIDWLKREKNHKD